MKILGFLVLSVLFVAPLFGNVTDPLPDSDFWGAILAFIGSLGSVKTAVIAFIALATTFFRVSIGRNLAGIWTLAVLYGLSAIAFAVEGYFDGVPFIQILSNAAFTGAVLNSANEIIKHLFVKKD